MKDLRALLHRSMRRLGGAQLAQGDFDVFRYTVLKLGEIDDRNHRRGVSL